MASWVSTTHNQTQKKIVMWHQCNRDVARTIEHQQRLGVSPMLLPVYELSPSLFQIPTSEMLSLFVKPFSK